jgi:hypoxanthine phosphoribosyltransferase
MKNIVLHDKKFELFLTSKEIEQAINKIAEGINKDLSQEEPLFIPILNGAFMFASELMKRLKFPCELSFAKVSSYKGTQSQGDIKQLIGIDQNLKGRTVVILEDIVDSGTTLQKVIETMHLSEPKSIMLAALLFKPDACKTNIKINYLGLEIPDRFVVGFGMDYNGLGRNYADIYQLKS